MTCLPFAIHGTQALEVSSSSSALQSVVMRSSTLALFTQPLLHTPRTK